MQSFHYTSTDARRSHLTTPPAVAVTQSITMPRRLATSWATLTKAARRAHGTAREDAADEQPFDWVDVGVVDVDEQEEQEPVQDPYTSQEPPPELDEVSSPPQEPEQVVLPPRVGQTRWLPPTCSRAGATSRQAARSGSATMRLGTPWRPPSSMPPSRARSVTNVAGPSWPPSGRRTSSSTLRRRSPGCSSSSPRRRS